ncbi:MAG: hypothetical protein R3B91_09095 [Planctomycetaceae bacterium]
MNQVLLVTEVASPSVKSTPGPSVAVKLCRGRIHFELRRQVGTISKTQTTLGKVVPNWFREEQLGQMAGL